MCERIVWVHAVDMKNVDIDVFWPHIFNVSIVYSEWVPEKQEPQRRAVQQITAFN